MPKNPTFADLDKARLSRRHSIEEACVELTNLIRRAGGDTAVSFPCYREWMHRAKKSIPWRPSKRRMEAVTVYVQRARGEA